ncbi:MAG TPA: sensor domain-containing protein [Streptosporangiaceae bacterium]
MDVTGTATAGAAVRAGIRAAVRAPFASRVPAEVLYAAVAALLGLAVPCAVLGFALALGMVTPGHGENVSIYGLVIAGVVLVLAATRLARGVGAVHRALARRLLGEDVRAPAGPPAAARGGRGAGARGAVTRLVARLVAGLRDGLRDGPGWRAAAYLGLKIPLALVQSYALTCWITGLVNVSYPFWWRLFRNHAPGVRLDPVLVFTTLPVGWFHVATYAGTFAAFAVGAAALLAAPWVTRAAVAIDRPLIRGLLGPGRLAQRVHDLELTRARAVDDSAALLRQVERDLHDGAQMRLAALALHLGLAKEKLGHAAGAPDLAGVRELVDAAHRGAKDALAELRDLARGLHPPALDNGLSDALATLAAGSAIPVELVSDVPVRPSPAIETIAYFCAAELLANAAKHSHADRIAIRATEQDGLLVVTVADDGVGGADPARGSGLRGLAARASMVDGRIDISSPPGGPTRVAVALPLRA